MTGDGNAALYVRREWLDGIRAEIIDALVSVVASLKARVSRAVSLTEAYCYEPYGRTSWRLAGRPANDQSRDNPVRRMWVAHNLSEDERVADLRLWSHTRAQVGSMSSKGARHLASEETRIRTSEEDRRLRVVADTFERLLNGEASKAKKLTVSVGGVSYEIDHIRTANSAEELEDEMARFVRGEKDLHDLVVEEYIRGIRERTQKARAEYNKAIETARQLGEGDGVTGGVNLVGHTTAQLAELGLTTTSTVSQVAASGAPSDLYDRYIGPETVPGWLGTSGNPEVIGAKPQASLQDRIAERRPRLDGLSKGT